MTFLGRAGLVGLVGVLAVVALGAERQTARKKLLFLTHAGLYKHTSLGPAEQAVIELGKTGGFDVTTVEGYKQGHSVGARSGTVIVTGAGGRAPGAEGPTALG